MNFHDICPKSVFAAVLTAVVVTGCGQTASKQPADGGQSATEGQAAEAEVHDPHDVPLTEEEKIQLRKDNEDYVDAVAHIQSYRDTIRTETTEGNPAKAHRALDNLDLVLEWLPEIAQKSGVPKSKWEEVNTTAQKLRDHFNAVHANIDDGKDPGYASVSAEIDKGVEALAAIEPEEGQ